MGHAEIIKGNDDSFSQLSEFKIFRIQLSDIMRSMIKYKGRQASNCRRKAKKSQQYSKLH